MVDGMGDANPSEALASTDEARQAPKPVESDVTGELQVGVTAGSTGYRPFNKAE
jgi:hypothetical protein